jgi:predicted porin
MNKRLLAVAVAGALAAPAVAFAQSSVTISGQFKGGFEGMKYGNSAKANNSQSGVADDSSRLVFNVVEDLGGGLAAIGQYDIRLKLDDPRIAPTAQDVNGNIAAGNTHVGLRSKTWGRIFVGRQDLHYFNRESDLTNRGSLRADSISILAFAGGGATAIAGATRTQNVVHYTTPNWGGFTAIVAYSANPTAAETDIGSGIRKGRAWNVNPNFQGANWQVGYSYWTSKNDGVVTTTCPAGTVTTVNGVGTVVCGAGGVSTTAATDQRGDRLYGSYTWGGFKFGLAWDKSKIKNAITGARTSDRTAWSLPLSYTWGAHSINAHFDKARADKIIGAGSDANMFAISYAYDLSKRTSAAVTYARINNKAAAAYNFFTATSLGIANAGAAAGEDPRMWGVTLRHQF